MTDYSFLKPGLRWARYIFADGKKKSAWCIIEITGNQPFMESRIVYKESGEVPFYDTISDPARWEYGHEIFPPRERKDIPDGA